MSPEDGESSFLKVGCFASYEKLCEKVKSVVSSESPAITSHKESHGPRQHI